MNFGGLMVFNFTDDVLFSLILAEPKGTAAGGQRLPKVNWRQGALLRLR
jgi:hypothetical protein